MLSEKWEIDGDKLICHYQQFAGGHEKFVFTLTEKHFDSVLSKWFFTFKSGRSFVLRRVRYDEDNKCYIPLFNNTTLDCYIKVDLSIFVNKFILGEAEIPEPHSIH